MNAAIYNETPYVVAQRNGGVGGLDESFSQALVAGRPFEHAWTGPMGCTTDQEPIIGTAGRSGNIVYCGGYTGHGIAMGTKAGSFLADMLHGGSPPAWMLRPTQSLPGEPLRYIAINTVINMMNLGMYHMEKHV